MEAAVRVLVVDDNRDALFTTAALGVALISSPARSTTRDTSGPASAPCNPRRLFRAAASWWV